MFVSKCLMCIQGPSDRNYPPEICLTFTSQNPLRCKGHGLETSLLKASPYLQDTLNIYASMYPRTKMRVFWLLEVETSQPSPLICSLVRRGSGRAAAAPRSLGGPRHSRRPVQNHSESDFPKSPCVDTCAYIQIYIHTYTYV